MSNSTTNKYQSFGRVNFAKIRSARDPTIRPQETFEVLARDSACYPPSVSVPSGKFSLSNSTEDHDVYITVLAVFFNGIASHQGKKPLRNLGTWGVRSGLLKCLGVSLKKDQVMAAARWFFLGRNDNGKTTQYCIGPKNMGDAMGKFNFLVGSQTEANRILTEGLVITAKTVGLGRLVKDSSFAAEKDSESEEGWFDAYVQRVNNGLEGNSKLGDEDEEDGDQIALESDTVTEKSQLPEAELDEKELDEKIEVLEAEIENKIRGIICS